MEHRRTLPSRNHRALGRSRLALALMALLVTPVVSLGTSSPARADTVIRGCTIVSSPGNITHTSCPDAQLRGPT